MEYVNGHGHGHGVCERFNTHGHGPWLMCEVALSVGV